MAHLSDKIKISLVPLIIAIAAAALLLVATMGGSGASSTGGNSFRADLQSHQDGSGPPRCRPASKYANDPHPSDPACKHKPEKHTKP